MKKMFAKEKPCTDLTTALSGAAWGFGFFRALKKRYYPKPQVFQSVFQMSLDTSNPKQCVFVVYLGAAFQRFVFFSSILEGYDPLSTTVILFSDILG